MPTAEQEIAHNITTASRAVPLSQRAIVWTLFLFSGACGLIYEVLWCRHLGLIFGNTVHSLSAVLTAFMGGLALGSYVAGRYCHLLKRPLLAYGILELLIGSYCAMLPWFLSDHGPLVPMYRSLYGETGGASIAITRFVISFILLLIPTTFMGATLPVLSTYLVRSSRFLGRTVGALYAINTFGAVVGAAATGFILLPLLGKAGTNDIAVVCNLVLGVVAVVAGWRSILPPAETAPALPADQKPVLDISPAALKLTIITFGVTGFAAMATQIGWTRAISLGTGSSTYAFSLIVSVFILGLSLGGVWGARLAGRIASPLYALGCILLSIGFISIALAVLLGYGPLMFHFLLAWGSDPSAGQMNWGMLLALQAAGIALLIIVPTFLMGATMPLTLQVASRSSTNPGKTVGTVYAINTLGAILGSFLGGLALLPALQIQRTLEVMALLYVIPGILMILLSSPRSTQSVLKLSGALVAVTLLVVALLPRWEPKLMSAGLFLLRDQAAVKAAREFRFAEAMPNYNREILYYQEGAACTVSVARTAGQIFLSVGGKPDASTGNDMSTQIGLTLLPAVLHPHPKDVLVIGLGSGVSAGAALARKSVESVDVVEMSPEVIVGSSWFADVNRLNYDQPRTPQARLNTPRVSMLINDGRNHLLLTSRKYDLIASEPSNPWLAGVGNLFTREAFELSKARLNPGGMMCQWVHSYSLDESHVYTIIRTFGDVFPHMQLWWINKGDYLLVGSNDPLVYNIKDLRQRLAEPSVHDWLAGIHLDTEYELLAGFIQGDDTLRKNASRSPIHSDDNMLLEFSAPRSLYSSDKTFSSMRLWRLPDSIVDMSGLEIQEKSEFLRMLDLAFAGRHHFLLASAPPAPANLHMERAFLLAPHQLWAGMHMEEIAKARTHAAPVMPPPPPSPLEVAEKQLMENHAAEALATLEKLPDDGGSAAGILKARALAQQKKFSEAFAALQDAGKRGADPLVCSEWAAVFHCDAGSFDVAREQLMSVLGLPGARRDPKTQHLWRLLAQINAASGDMAAAEEPIRIAANLDMTDQPTLRLASRIFTELKKFPDAAACSVLLEHFLPDDQQVLVQTIEALNRTGEARAQSDAPLAYASLSTARRFCRELTTWQPEYAQGWLLQARTMQLLAALDAKERELFVFDARAAIKKFVELNGNDASKVPADLQLLLEPAK